MSALEKKQPRALVVGASGQVGTQMLGVLGASALATSRVEREGWLQLDLAEVSNREQAGAILNEHELDAIYCVGGMTYVDGCEANSDLAWRTNAIGPGALAAYARERNVPYVFFSTEYVFDGTDDDPGPYIEEARTNPLNAYGRSKLEGEYRVQEAYDRALVVRTTVVYGPDPREKNYLYALMRNLAAGERMQVPEDQISTPTYNRDLIHAVLGLVEARATGMFHIAGPEVMDRLAFAKQAAEHVGLDAALLEGVQTSALSQPAVRPLRAGLATEKLRRLYPELVMGTLEKSLKSCSAELEEFRCRLKKSS